MRKKNKIDMKKMSAEFNTSFIKYLEANAKCELLEELIKVVEQWKKELMKKKK